MSQQLKGKKVTIPVENGFEQEELTRPKAALEEAGAQTDTVEEFAEGLRRQ